MWGNEKICGALVAPAFAVFLLQRQAIGYNKSPGIVQNQQIPGGGVFLFLSYSTGGTAVHKLVEVDA